jgi:hypothetical protein
MSTAEVSPQARAAVTSASERSQIVGLKTVARRHGATGPPWLRLNLTAVEKAAV